MEKRNILVVEDEKNISDVIVAYLEKEDFNTFVAANGKEAINSETQSFLNKTDYIKKEHGSKTVTEKNGSIYIKEKGEERCIKKFYGLHDRKFTGYYPVGFSPDGKYLVYNSMEYLTPLGSISGHLLGEIKQV